MIKRKIIELDNIKFQLKNEEWMRTDASASINDDDGEPELEIHINSVTIAIPIQDIIDCLQQLDIDLEAWAGE